MHSLIILIHTVIRIFVIMLIVQAILSWLVAFNVLNPYRHRWVSSIGDALYRLTEPMLRPIRRFLPNINGIDISPLIALLLLEFLDNLLFEYFYY